MSTKVSLPKTNQHLVMLQGIQRGTVEPPPIAKLLEITMVSIEHGQSLFEMQADGRLANPMGTMHGGIVCDLADIAMGTAMASTLEDHESFTTLDLTAKYFKPVWNSKLRARAHVVKRTRQLGLIECEIEDEKESLVAKVYSTCMVLRGEEAKGR